MKLNGEHDGDERFFFHFELLLFIGSGERNWDFSGGDGDGGSQDRFWRAIEGIICERAWIYCSNGSVTKGADPY